MLWYIVSSLWFSRHADSIVKKSRRRLLFVLVFSVSVLIAVGAVFSGFQKEFEAQYQKEHKIWLMYASQARLEAFYEWVKAQEGVVELTRYGGSFVKLTCGDSEGLAWVRVEPNYWHSRLLVNELALHSVAAACTTSLKLTAYDVSHIFPVAHEVSVPFHVVPMPEVSLPTVVVSPSVSAQLHLKSDALEAIRVGLPKNKNVMMWLHAGGWSDIRAVDMTQWQLDFSQALFSQKVMMWLVMGLMLASAMFQLKHAVEEMLLQQKKFWALMMVHGVSRQHMVSVFSYYVFGYVLVTLALSMPFGFLLAHAMNPLVLWIERLFSVRILDPQFFITDHIPVAWVWMDVFWVESCVCVMACAAVYVALRRSRRWDAMEILKHV